MNVNKKFDRFKQWAGEKMGGEVKTNTSEDFRALEVEMTLRYEGMERLHRSMSHYVKVLGNRSAIEDRDKMLPIQYVGTTMIGHGQDFEPDSEFGNCLISMGRANEALGRRQETYTSNATTIWLESLERSLAQMKEYQAARKKLETRRLAYDTSLAKMAKAKKEDFRVEEELRAQKAKYEESSEDVYRRMEDIKESEAESVSDLTQFLEAELAYHESCRDILLELRKNWPGHSDKKLRNRSNTAHSFVEKYTSVEEELAPPPRMTIPKVSRTESAPTADTSPRLLTRTSSVKAEFEPRPSSAGSFTQRFSPPREIIPTRELNSGSAPDGTGSIITNGQTNGYISSNGYTSSNGSSPVNGSIGARPIPRSSETSSSVFARGPGGLMRPMNPGDVDGGQEVNGMSAGGMFKGPPPVPSRAKKPAPPPPVKRATFGATTVGHIGA